MPGRENSTYFIFRIDEKIQLAEKSWQFDQAKLEGIDQIEASIKGAPKGQPASYARNDWSYLQELNNGNPLKKILTAKTFEMSVIPKKDDETNGIYVRWDFSPTLKELKASGELDRACEMMLGSDYITVQPTKQTKAETTKKEK